MKARRSKQQKADMRKTRAETALKTYRIYVAGAATPKDRDNVRYALRRRLDCEDPPEELVDCLLEIRKLKRVAKEMQT